MSRQFFRYRSRDRTRIEPLYGRIATVFTPLFALIIIIGLIASQLLHITFAQATADSKPVVLSGTLSPLIAHSYLDNPANPQEHITLSLGLRPRNQANMTKYVQAITQPHTPNYRRFLTPKQYEELFSPDRTTYAQVQQFLRAAGFSIQHRYKHRLLIDFQGTIAQAEQTFHVEINMYTAPDGHVYYANAAEPLLPAWLAPSIVSINGLNNATRWQHPTLFRHAVQKNKRTATGNCPISGKNLLTPRQVARGYGLDTLYQAHLQGEGQSIALFELDSIQMADLKAYVACFGGGHTTIQTFVAGSNPPAIDAGMIEAEMDAELLLGAAPQLDTLKIYEGANNDSDYLATWAQIIQDAPAIVSTSWGQCETTEIPNMVQQENILFEVAALQGQSILAATGDSGSAACARDGKDAPTQLAVSDPAAQPFVTAVGGTRLTLNPDDSYGSETAWNNRPDEQTISAKGSGGGGGISQYWTMPDWQQTAGVADNTYSSALPCAQHTGQTGEICREIPDVAFHADPQNGYMIYCTVFYFCDASQPWLVVGGTSTATQLWATMTALTNELLRRQGGERAGFLNPLLYKIAQDPLKYVTSFHDVKLGNNDYQQLNEGSYPATAGYDMATGLGSYNAFMLASNLVHLVQPESSTHRGSIEVNEDVLMR